FARSRSSRACSSLYFGVAVAIGEGERAKPTLLFALAFAFMFESVLLQAINAKPDTRIAVSHKTYFLILSAPFTCSSGQKRIASFTVSWRFFRRDLLRLRRSFCGLCQLSL